MPATTTITSIPTEVAPTVRWEPCSQYHDDGPEAPVEGSGLCAGCGWPADDHALAAAA